MAVKAFHIHIPADVSASIGGGLDVILSFLTWHRPTCNILSGHPPPNLRGRGATLLATPLNT